jgi:hypothetical protein
MTRDDFVSEMIEQAKPQWDRYWSSLPDAQRLRLAGMEAELLSIERELRRRLWSLVGASLESLAQEQVGSCRCGRRRERRAASVTLDVLGEHVELPCSYFYCGAVTRASVPCAAGSASRAAGSRSASSVR